MICAFTGHRKINNRIITGELSDLIRKEIVKALTKLEITQAISGMAIGVDTIAVEACLELDIPFTAAVPFKGQESRWPLESQKYYQTLLNKSSNIVFVSEGGYAPWKFQIRNEYLVDNSDILIAVFNNSPGGTANCVNYARKIGKEIHIIDPSALNI